MFMLEPDLESEPTLWRALVALMYSDNVYLSITVTEQKLIL
jgi:hypothetical protein